jgi:hypothetical protein
VFTATWAIQQGIENAVDENYYEIGFDSKVAARIQQESLPESGAVQDIIEIELLHVHFRAQFQQLVSVQPESEQRGSSTGERMCAR